MRQWHYIEVIFIVCLAKANTITQYRTTNVQALTDQGYEKIPKKCVLRFFLPLQCNNDDVNTIRTTEIDRHGQRSTYAYMY